ncbi:hypothetical protein OEZ60_21880, partial [Defluviimonas sp. WL0024]
FTFIAGFRDTHDTGSLLPAVVDLPAAADHPCLVFEAEGRRRALWVITLSADDKIARFDILTVAPSPAMARLATNLA